MTRRSGRHACGGGLTGQRIEMRPDMRGLRGRVGERDCLIEGLARLPVTAKLHQEIAPDAEEMEVTAELVARLSVINGEGCKRSSVA